MSVNAMEPWQCPWCGEGPDDLNESPDYHRAIHLWDRWLEAHVTECEPYLKEQGRFADDC
jgi:hypothetical protein